MTKKEGKCSICGNTYTDYGHNAEPINSGRCCQTCNDTKVLSQRLKEYYLVKEEHYV